MVTLIFPSRKEKDGASRLRYLYGNLIGFIDVGQDLERRSMEKVPPNKWSSLVQKLQLAALSASEALLINDETTPASTENEFSEEESKDDQKHRDLAAAFRVMQATKSTAAQPNSPSAMCVTMLREAASASALNQAKLLETRVSQCIASIGEVVINAAAATEPAKNGVILRSDDVFAYFCEKNILSLLVAIVKDKPSDQSESREPSCFHGVVWSPVVKAQVIHTISSLITSVRDPSALYYLLSQNCLNVLITCMLPLAQWTDPALETMLHVYVNLLKNLGLHLRSSARSLFALYTHGKSFPLLQATLETAISDCIATSDSFVHLTCLSLMVDLLQVKYEPLQEWILNAHVEQYRLAEHACNLVLGRFHKLAQLTTGPIVDGVRANALTGQLQGLGEELDLMNDIFFCGIQCLNVRLCELFLQKTVRRLLRSLLPTDNRQFLVVGVVDADVIPRQEACAQAATVVLARILERIEYAPLIRMIAVALWHPISTSLWDREESETEKSQNSYYITTSLHAIASLADTDQNNCKKDVETNDTIDNPYRDSLLEILRGSLGPWRLSTVATLAEKTLVALDKETLKSVSLLTPHGGVSVLEESVAFFLLQKHSRASTISSTALECIIWLAIEMIRVTASTEQGPTPHSEESPVWHALLSARDYHYIRASDCHSLFGVADIYVDLVESTIETRYRKRTNIIVEGTNRARYYYAFSLVDHRACLSGAEMLVRKMKGVTANEVESTRFFIQAALHLRATCRCLERFHIILQTAVQSSVTLQNSSGRISLDLVDPAEELCNIFGILRVKPPIGTDLDLRGRTTFRFTLGQDAKSLLRAQNRETSELILILDTSDILIVRPQTPSDVVRGHVICCIPLLNVIAAAGDASWLHVAVKHNNVTHLIKNGNMTLCFDSPGTCLIVCRYLDRCRLVLRRELLGKVLGLFSVHVPVEEKSGSPNDTGIPHPLTL